MFFPSKQMGPDGSMGSFQTALAFLAPWPPLSMIKKPWLSSRFVPFQPMISHDFNLSIFKKKTSFFLLNIGPIQSSFHHLKKNDTFHPWPQPWPPPAAVRVRCDGVLNQRVRFSVHRRGRLVQQQNGIPSEQGPGQAHLLSLTSADTPEMDKGKLASHEMK